MANTLYEYYKSQGQSLPSISERAKLFTQYGLGSNYQGTASQNTALLGKLVAGGSTPSTTPTPSATPSTGGFTADQLKTAYNKILGRDPDPTGLSYYTSSQFGGKSMADLEQALTNSDEYRKKTANPTTADEVSKRISDVNNMAFDKFQLEEAPKVRTQKEIKTDITSQLPAETEKPTAPKLEALFTKLSEQLGVQDLEDLGTELKAQKEELWAQYRSLVYDERGKPILSRLIAGRTSQAARDLQEQLDFITRQESINNDKLTTRYNLINMKMGFTQADYQTAKSEYDSEYSQAISLINAVSTVQSSEKAELKAFKDDARANLAVYSKLFASGQVTWDGLTGDQKTQLNKLEVQAGLGVGYLRSVQSLSGGGVVKSISTRQSPDGYEYADAITVMPDGSLKVISTQLGKYRVPSTGSQQSTDLSKRQITFLDDASDWVERLASTDYTKKVDWGTAFNAMRTKYPEATNEEIDQALQYNTYYPKPAETTQPAQTSQKTGWWQSVVNWFTGK